VAETTPRDVIEAVAKLEEQVKGLAKYAPTEDEKRRVDDRLNKFDEAQQKVMLEFKRLEGLETEIEAKKAEIETLDGRVSKTSDRLVELEAMIAQRDLSNSKGKNYRDLAEVKAIESWLRRPDAVP
jgi:septal ring factor EnvC (AmiA/AmiB activator)